MHQITYEVDLAPLGKHWVEVVFFFTSVTNVKSIRLGDVDITDMVYAHPTAYDEVFEYIDSGDFKDDL